MSIDYGANPEGFAAPLPPPPMSYRIRRITFPYGYPTRFALMDNVSWPAYELGEVETHRTLPAFDYSVQRYFHALNSADQFFADRCTALIQRACEWFYKPDGEYEPMEGVADIIVTDTEIDRRIAQIDLGENTREAKRTAKQRYPISELPYDQQRALIENLDALAHEFGFSKIVAPEESA
jgi:hypothetical protein